MIQAQYSQRTTLKKIVIDPGHGGQDPGAVGAISREKDINLDISLRLGKMINEKYPEVEVIYTRTTDVLVDLDRRGEIANQANADLFISIHCNAAENRRAVGTETFVMGHSREADNMEVARRENSVIVFEEDYTTRYYGFDPHNPESQIIFSLHQSVYQNQSIAFAALIQEQFRATRRVDRSVKQERFLVLWQTAMPSVLVEVGFITNAEEERYMNSVAGKDQLARVIFQAFSSYKAQIEDRSLFRIIEPVAVIAQPEQNTSPKVEFCIQISGSSRLIDTNPNNFNGLTGVERFQISENLFRYIVGRTENYAAAQENLIRVRALINDAFIVSIVDGRIVPAAEGLRLITE